MLTLAIIGTCLGALVGLRFNVLALLGIIYVVMFVLLVGAVMRGMTNWSITLAIVNVTISMCVGYFCTAALPCLLARVFRFIRRR